MKVRYIGVSQAPAYERCPGIEQIAMEACIGTVIYSARARPVRVALPYRRMPYGLWCSVNRAARLLGQPRRTLRDHAARGSELSYRPKECRDRVVFIVALAPKRRGK